MIPPPIPKRLEIKPAVEDPKYSNASENNLPLFSKSSLSSLIDFLINKYILVDINNMAKYNLNSSGSRAEEIKAPMTEKGTAEAATLIPIL
jgi:hypothetical protein